MSGTDGHCDHTVHFSADLSLWLDITMFRLSPVPSGREVGHGRITWRNQGQGYSGTVVSIRVPETVLRVKRTGQWAWLG